MEIEFDNLISLQNLDTEIKHISALLDNIPFQISEIDQNLKSAAQIVAGAKEKLVSNQKKRRDLENEVQDLKTHISKYKIQLNEVKTNKEYQALLKEIDEAQQRIDSLEEEIISEMLSADDINEEIKEAILKYNQEKEKLDKEKATINQRKKELEIKIQKLNQEKERFVHQISPYQIKLYREISQKKNGIALSPVKDDFCSMCHMRIRPQVINELIGEKKLLLCENCGRILYWQKKSA